MFLASCFGFRSQTVGSDPGSDVSKDGLCSWEEADAGGGELPGATVSHPDWTPERGKAETGSVSVSVLVTAQGQLGNIFFFFFLIYLLLTLRARQVFTAR